MTAPGAQDQRVAVFASLQDLADLDVEGASDDRRRLVDQRAEVHPLQGLTPQSRHRGLLGRTVFQHLVGPGRLAVALAHTRARPGSSWGELPVSLAVVRTIPCPRALI